MLLWIIKVIILFFLHRLGCVVTTPEFSLYHLPLTALLLLSCWLYVSCSRNWTREKEHDCWRLGTRSHHPPRFSTALCLQRRWWYTASVFLMFWMLAQDHFFSPPIPARDVLFQSHICLNLVGTRWQTFQKHIQTQSFSFSNIKGLYTFQHLTSFAHNC